MKLFRSLIVILFVVSLSQTAMGQLNRSYFFSRGRYGIVNGQYSDAINSLNVLLRVDNKAYEGYFLRGVAKYNLEDLPGAEADFSRAIDENPIYTQAYNYRAVTRSRMGRYSDALSDFDKAIDMRPNNPGCYFGRGVTHFLNHQFDKAIDDYSRFLKIESHEPDGYINRGTCYLYSNDTVAAMKDYNRAIEVHPYYETGYLRRGMVLLMQGKYQESMEDMTSALRIDSTFSAAYFYRAAARSYVGQLVGAMEDYDSAIKYDSANSVIYFNRAIIRSQVGDYNRAVEDYDRVAQFNPGNVLVFYNRGSVKGYLGNLQGAANDYTRAIELYPDFANAYLRRSDVLWALGNAQQSRKDKATANAKINQYKKNVDREKFSQFADTSAQFTKLLSFDADFGNNPLMDIGGSGLQAVRLLPLFRLAVDTTQRQELYGYDPRKYSNPALEQYIENLGIKNIVMTNKSVEKMPVNSQQNDWRAVFASGVSMAMEHQYTGSLEMWNYLASDRQTDAYVLLNKGVTEAEMIEFIASLEGNGQSLTIDLDGSSASTQGKQQKNTVYDYSSPIEALEKAARLNPKLPHIYYNLGNLYSMGGNTARAMINYNKALELFPYFGECYYNRGLVQIFMGDIQTGLMDISKAGEMGIDKAYDILKRYQK